MAGFLSVLTVQTILHIEAIRSPELRCMPFPPAHNIGSYTVAYVDFFDRKVEERSGDWRSVVEEYLYATSEPIINGLVGGRTCLYIASVSIDR